LLLADAIAAAEGQKDKKVRIPRKHEQIIEQIQLAMANDVPPSYEMHRRLGESLEALHKIPDALSNIAPRWRWTRITRCACSGRSSIYSSGKRTQTARPLRWKSILARKDVTDSERSWALCESAHLKIDRSNFNDARQLLAAAEKLSADSVDQGQINFCWGTARGSWGPG